MRSSGPRRIVVAAWLGLVALGIQALVPALLAIDIEIAGAQAGASAFINCPYGHLDNAAHHEGSGKSSDTPRQGDGHGAACPVCIALLASPPFTTPAQITLPTPVAVAVGAPVPVARQARTIFAAAAYRSRAPPIG